MRLQDVMLDRPLARRNVPGCDPFERRIEVPPGSDEKRVLEGGRSDEAAAHRVPISLTTKCTRRGSQAGLAALLAVSGLANAGSRAACTSSSS